MAADKDALEMLSYFQDNTVEQICDDGEASTDLLNDYTGADSYHHKIHVDKAYDLQEATEILREYRDYEETDSGIWEGLEPVKAIGAKAAYTYGNAVYNKWRDLVEELNSEYDSNGFEDLFSAYETVEGYLLSSQSEDSRVFKSRIIKEFIEGFIKGKQKAHAN